jgi:hypothetical protein
VIKDSLARIGRSILPRRARREIAKLGTWPPVGHVGFGSLRRVTPISTRWGLDRGEPIDRYYIRRFIESNAERVRGTVFEVGEKRYSLIGGDRVEQFEILHVSERKPGVTIVGDLSDPEVVPENSYDCMVITQVFQLIYDLRTTIENCHAFLKPGGSLLTTFPGISQISRYDMDRWGHYWALTSRSAERLFGEIFEGGEVEVVAFGNVLSSISFLHGLAVEELRMQELDYHDPDYQMLLGVRATKAS